MEEEVWKDVKGYEGYYEVSNLGIVRSLERMVWNGGFLRRVNNRILKRSHRSGYEMVGLSKDGCQVTVAVHQLVAIAFLNHNRSGNELIIDHIDGNKTNNKLSNIHIVTSRENNSICFRKNAAMFSSKFTGVSFFKRDKNWESYITINRKRKYLGRFPSEQEASNAYQKALKSYI